MFELSTVDLIFAFDIAVFCVGALIVLSGSAKDLLGAERQG